MLLVKNKTKQKPKNTNPKPILPPWNQNVVTLISGNTRGCHVSNITKSVVHTGGHCIEFDIYCIINNAECLPKCAQTKAQRPSGSAIYLD